MSMTSNLKLPYLAAAQAQKHITHNEALRALDALVQIGVLDRDLTVPPGTPADGDCYIVAAAATGAWAGRDGRLAAWQDGVWMFYAPREGWVAWVADEDALVAWDGAAWVLVVGGVASVNPVALVGVNTTADATNRFAVKSDAMLFSHDDVTPGSGDMRQVLNKADSLKTASQLYQSGFSGRAETGLTGDDDFHVKVSPDGATWNDAIIVNRYTGSVRLPNTSKPWKDRNWVAIGTSISAQGHYTTPLEALLGADLLNLGVGGGTVAGSMIPNQIPLIPANTDLVTLEAGTNDFPSGLPLGGIGDTTTASFYGALHVAVRDIMARAPNALIALMTPFSAGPGPSGTMAPHIASRTYLATQSGTNLRQWQQAIRDVAAWTGWPVIDVGRDSGINYWTVGEYTTDGLHPIGIGGERMAQFIADRLIEMVPRAGTYVPPLSGSTLDPTAKGASAVLSNGNLDISSPLTAAWTMAKGSLSHNTGLRYFEAIFVSGVTSSTLFGLADGTTSAAGLNTYPGAANFSIGVRPGSTFNLANSVIVTGASIGATFTTVAPGDTIMVAVDFDGGSLWFGRNGNWFTGTPASGSSVGRNGSFTPGLPLFPALGVVSPNVARFVPTTAEQTYLPPSGFSAWG